MNRQFELLNLKACKIWYMLDGSYVAVKTVGSKSLIAKKKFFFYICTGLYSKQPCGWITWSPIFSQLSKIFFIYRIYSNYLGPMNI